jgi:hypothetical protein
MKLWKKTFLKAKSDVLPSVKVQQILFAGPVGVADDGSAIQPEPPSTLERDVAAGLWCSLARPTLCGGLEFERIKHEIAITDLLYQFLSSC